MSLFIFATSAIFDFNDYNDPIKYFINDRFYYSTISDMRKDINIYVRENSVELNDSIFQFTPSLKQSKFISIEESISNLKKINKDNVVINLAFAKDQTTVSYQRTVLTFLD